MPWWQYVKIRESAPRKADIVICERAISEMSQFAREHVIKVSRRMLDGPGMKVFMFGGMGGTRFVNLQHIVNDFIRGGFDLINVFGFFAFTPRGSELSKYKVHNYEDLFSRGLGSRIARRFDRTFVNRLAGKFYQEFCLSPFPMQFGPQEGKKVVHAGDIVSPRWDEAPDSYKFLSYIGRKIPPAN